MCKNRIGLFIIALTVPFLVGCSEQVPDASENLRGNSAAESPLQISDLDSTNENAGIFSHVYETLDAFVRDASFSALRPEEKQARLTPSLDMLVEDGYLSEYHFHLEVQPAMLDFQFSCGGIGAYQLEAYREDEN